MDDDVKLEEVVVAQKADPRLDELSEILRRIDEGQRLVVWQRDGVLYVENHGA